ncbi:MAG: DUF2934 domain-containing protein [Methylococcales bacterium]|nr:DUF2934 domain-containing protein [Methylococcales bacterium]
MVLEKSSIENVENIVQETPAISKNEEGGRQYEIAMAAFFKAERRGFAPGRELNDWLEAKHDIMGSP